MFSKLKAIFGHKPVVLSHRGAYSVLLGGAIAALIAAFVLSVEKLELLKNPDAVLSCSVNLVINCSTVMQTWQATVIGDIPNSYFGMMAFPVIITVAVAALFGGARYNRGFLIAMKAGLFLGTLFAYWLFFSSVYVIQVLCPWCLLVTFSTTLMLAAATHINLTENVYRLPKQLNEKVQKFLKAGYYQMVVASWIIILILLVFLKFGNDLFA